MGRVKDWMMDIEEDAYNLPYLEFAKQHPFKDADNIYERVNGPEYPDEDNQ